MSPFWILLALRMMEVVLTTGAVRCAKLQSGRHHQQTNTQFFYRLDALTAAQPTVSELKEIIYTPRYPLLYPIRVERRGWPHRNVRPTPVLDIQNVLKYTIYMCGQP